MAKLDSVESRVSKHDGIYTRLAALEKKVDKLISYAEEGRFQLQPVEKK